MSEQQTPSPSAWLAEIESHIWAMAPGHLSTLLAYAHEGRAFADAFQVNITPEAKEAARQRGRPRNIQGGVATVDLKGTIMPMGGLLAMLFGLENPLDTFMRGVREAVADPEIGAVVMNIDSPGGVVDGVPEAAAELRKMRGSKPMIAVSNTLMASAAYWLGSQADEVVITPSGEAGSIGVYATHRDMSGMQALMGIKTTLVSAGKFKTEGNPFEPLSETAQEHLQEAVNDFYGMFVADVAKGRDATVAAVKGGYGEGRVLTPKRAVEAGLADRVETIGEAVGRLAARRSSTGVAALRAEAEAGAQAEDETAPVVADEVTEPVQAEADAGADPDTEAQGEPDEYTAEEKDRLLDVLHGMALDGV